MVDYFNVDHVTIQVRYTTRHISYSTKKGSSIMMIFKRTIALILSISLGCFSFGTVQAAMVSNGQIINNMHQVNDKETLLQTLMRADVQAQLSDMGVNSADLESRIDQMTYEEIAQLNQQMAELPAGSGALGVVLVVFVVFVITDVIGATDIFPFIHPVR
jgi:hypothetical protein